MSNPFLLFYSRRDVQEELAEHSLNREIVPKFGNIFGKRPDVVKYPNDVFELAKQGATSFHASEELWKNPLNISTELKKHELDNLRIGWDLMIDIDCPVWEYSKLIAHFVVKSLKRHNINSISCKFSGNKGFHIAIPFETFPSTYQDNETRLLFPDAARTLAAYLIEDIDQDKEFSSIILSKGIDSVIEKTKLDYNTLVLNLCKSCKTVVKKKHAKFEYICSTCAARETIEKDELFKKCKKCNKQMEKKELTPSSSCPNCKSKETYEKFNVEEILNIDAIMLSSRHLYRMPYSMHEKSGLVSIPVDVEKIMDFDKKQASPFNLKIPPFKFLDKEKAIKNESTTLFDKAFALKAEIDSEKKQREDLKHKVYESSSDVKFEQIQEAIPEELFPPCITLILKGIEDGKKRAIFSLVNFLATVGWDHDKIESRLKEWNSKNKPPLKENYVTGQIRYHKQFKKNILPPNCNNEMYMKGINVCQPDNYCARIKNPANYSIRKVIGIKKNTKQKKTDSQKKDEKVKKEEIKDKETKS
tara:strand:+ start:3450 stop:5039 length:1590 start_codon:yes stop_codon:yes gene_type:complete